MGSCKSIVFAILAITFLSLAIVCLVGFIILPVLYTQLSYEEQEQYAIVMDAGSSHSDIYLYKWELPLYQGTGLVSQDRSCKSAGRAISTYTVPSDAADSFESCINEVLSNVPSSINNPPDDKVNMWLGATAGMRILRHENMTLANGIITAINGKYDDETQINAKILSGQEEALNRWISTNYIDGRLERSAPSKRDMTGSTIGILDNGGGDGDSLEIGFANSSGSSDHVQSTTLFGTSYDVYARSYLCYGTLEGFRRVMAYAIKSANYSSTLNMSCYPIGFTQSLSSSYIFGNHYCSNGLRPTDTTNIPTRFNVTGTSDPVGCRALVEAAMNFSINISNGESINYVPPRPTGSFYGFSNFYYAGNAFKTYYLNSSILPLFEANVSSRCSLTWDEMNALHESDRYRVYRCIDSVIILHFLENGLGFVSTHSDWSINITNQINNVSPGWSIGYMLQKSSDIAMSADTVYPFSSVGLIVGMIVLIIICVVSIIIFGLMCFVCLRSRSD